MLGLLRRMLPLPHSRGYDGLLVQTYPDLANATELPMVYKLSNQLGLSGMLACAPIEFFGGR